VAKIASAKRVQMRAVGMRETEERYEREKKFLERALQYKQDKSFLENARKNLKTYHPLNSKGILHWIPYQVRDAFPFLVTWPVIVPKHLFMPIYLAQMRIKVWNDRF
jgi:hypothetical protein